jgi:hypothetical protein
MQIRLHAMAVALVLAAAQGPASAWDYPGHRIVGNIADIVLQRDHAKTHERVTTLLAQKLGDEVDRRDLREVSVFPDCAKNEKRYCGRDPSPEEIQYVLRNIVHKSFHFTNSPLQEKSYRAGGIGTSETDVVQMINYTVTQLKGGKPYKHEVKLTNTEAVFIRDTRSGRAISSANRSARLATDWRRCWWRSSRLTEWEARRGALATELLAALARSSSEEFDSNRRGGCACQRTSCFAVTGPPTNSPGTARMS